MTSPFHQENKVISSIKKKPVKTYNPSQEGPGKSDMIGLPGTEFRKKVDSEVKNYKAKSPMKMITEKGSYEKGKVEKYASKKAMAKHEKKETKSFEKKEAVKPKSPMKQLTQHPTKPSGTVKKVPAKMKKC